MRVARDLPPHVRKLAVTSSPERVNLLRASGLEPLLANLDQPKSLSRLAGLATRVLYLAPPPSNSVENWWLDPRAKQFAMALRRRSCPTQLVYGSTTGVYGDCKGEWVNESRALAANTPRALRRVDAEAQMLLLGRSAVASCVLRIPGIYATDRDGGTPRARLAKGTPVLLAQDDVYTNHIHADDLAQACVAALWRGKTARVYNVCDDTELKMGDYFDLAADLYGLPRPPRISRETAQGQLPLMLLSFMSESRRIVNDRMKRELRVMLRYSNVMDGLQI